MQDESGAPDIPTGNTEPPRVPRRPTPPKPGQITPPVADERSSSIDDSRQTKLAVELILGLLGIGLTVGVAVGLTEHSVALGVGLGFAAALLAAFLIWLLFGPLKKVTLWVLKPLLDRFEPVSSAIAGLTGFVSSRSSLFR